jgi:hypothetical protein
MALAAIPQEHLTPLHAALTRMAADRGWDADIRGLCAVLSALLDDSDAGFSLRDHLDALDETEVTNGSLAWITQLADEAEPEGES